MATAPTMNWPLFGLTVRTDEVTLRYPDDEMLLELSDLAAAGIHDEGFMPFAMPWSREPQPELQRKALQFHWRCRAETTPESFRIPLAAFVDGELIGTSDLFATSFPTLRQFETGSWLGREFQGRGHGTAMRRATLALGFDGLGAERALTGAWEDNAASLGVTRKLGYSEQGHRWGDREGTATRLVGFEMDRSDFDAIRPTSVEFTGLDDAREFLGITAD
ncbi:MAG: GNAT family protein [Actinomycetota bacterium]